MDLLDLVHALMDGDALAAREWAQEARRNRFDWSVVPEPRGLDSDAMAVAAGIVELLAQRAVQASPAWTAGVPAASRPVYLVRAAASMQRLRRLCQEEGPEPLRKRNLLAPPDFLTAA